MPPTPCNDDALVQAARSGDRAAAEQLVERLACIPAMLRVRERRLGAALASEERREVVQETLASVWSKLGSYRSGTPLEPWVFGFVVREHLKALERRRRSLQATNVDRVEAPGGEAHADDDDLGALHRCIAELGSPSAEIVRMRHFDELDFRAIGHELDLPINTVKTRYYRAILRMRALLRPLRGEVSG